MFVPNISFGFTPKMRIAISAIPRVTTTLPIIARITKSNTACHPQGTRKSSEIPECIALGAARPGNVGGLHSTDSVAAGGPVADSEALSGDSLARALTGAAPDGL